MKILIGILFFCIAFFMVRFSEYSNAAISGLAIVLLALPSYYYFTKNEPKKSVITILTISLFAVCIETIGILTGFPYSEFYYNDLGYKLFGTTPWTIFFAFTPLVLGAVYYAKKISTNNKKLFLYAVLLLILIDLILDPVAVKLGFWTWLNPGLYYDIPLQNYFGWLFSGIIAVSMYYWLYQTNTHEGQELTTYFSTWLWFGASLFMQLWIPVMVGLLLLLFFHKDDIITRLKREVKTNKNASN
jgi:bisanhydrobacterioruberin hydratase